MEIKYSIRFKSNSVGYSGSIKMKIVESKLFEIRYNDSLIDDLYPNIKQIKHAVEHGINIFFNSNKEIKENDYAILVEDIDYNSIDSSLTIIVVVTYNALADFFSLPKNKFIEVNEDRGTFIFRK